MNNNSDLFVYVNYNSDQILLMLAGTNIAILIALVVYMGYCLYKKKTPIPTSIIVATFIVIFVLLLPGTVNLLYNHSWRGPIGFLYDINQQGHIFSFTFAILVVVGIILLCRFAQALERLVANPPQIDTSKGFLNWISKFTALIKNKVESLALQLNNIKTRLILWTFSLIFLIAWLARTGTSLFLTPSYISLTHAIFSKGATFAIILFASAALIISLIGDGLLAIGNAAEEDEKPKPFLHRLSTAILNWKARLVAWFILTLFIIAWLTNTGDFLFWNNQSPLVVMAENSVFAIVLIITAMFAISLVATLLYNLVYSAWHWVKDRNATTLETIDNDEKKKAKQKSLTMWLYILAVTLALRGIMEVIGGNTSNALVMFVSNINWLALLLIWVVVVLTANLLRRIYDWAGGVLDKGREPEEEDDVDPPIVDPPFPPPTPPRTRLKISIKNWRVRLALWGILAFALVTWLLIANQAVFLESAPFNSANGNSATNNLVANNPAFIMLSLISAALAVSLAFSAMRAFWRWLKDRLPDTWRNTTDEAKLEKLRKIALYGCIFPYLLHFCLLSLMQ